MEDPKRCQEVIIELRDHANEICNKLLRGGSLPEMDVTELGEVWDAVRVLDRVNREM